jgi:hypothetical protein
VAAGDRSASRNIDGGDQVRWSHHNAGGTNMSKTFKKADGC